MHLPPTGETWSPRPPGDRREYTRDFLMQLSRFPDSDPDSDTDRSDPTNAAVFRWHAALPTPGALIVVAHRRQVMPCRDALRAHGPDDVVAHIAVVSAPGLARRTPEARHATRLVLLQWPAPLYMNAVIAGMRTGGTQIYRLTPADTIEPVEAP